MTKEEAQKLLDKIQQMYHLDINEVMHDGTRIEYASTENGDIEIVLGSPKKEG